MKRKIYKEDILKAGHDIMFLNGYNATGIKEITDKVNIPKGSFYNYFKSKEEFGLEVLKYHASHAIKYHERVLLDADMPPLSRLIKFFSDLIDKFDDVSNRRLGCIMGNFSQELASTNKNFRVALDQEFNACETILVQCLTEARDKGQISKDLDPKLVGSFLLNSWQGAILRMKSMGTTKPLKDFKDFILKKLVN